MSFAFCWCRQPWAPEGNTFHVALSCVSPWQFGSCKTLNPLRTLFWNQESDRLQIALGKSVFIISMIITHQLVEGMKNEVKEKLKLKIFKVLLWTTAYVKQFLFLAWPKCSYFAAGEQEWIRDGGSGGMTYKDKEGESAVGLEGDI